MSSALDFFKKQRISFYILVLAAVFTFIGLIMFIVSNSTQGFEMINGGWIIFASIAAILLLACGVFAASRFGDKSWITAAIFVVVVLLGVSFAFTISSRVGSAAELFTYDNENVLRASSFYSAIVAAVFYLVSAVMVTVSGFLKLGTKA